MVNCSLRGHKCGQQKRALSFELLSTLMLSLKQLPVFGIVCSPPDLKHTSSAFLQLSEASYVGV